MCAYLYIYIELNRPLCLGLTFQFMGQILQNKGPHLGSRSLSEISQLLKITDCDQLWLDHSTREA